MTFSSFLNESKIKGVVALDVLQLTKTSYEGKIFIDCTGDGLVAFMAGAEIGKGREDGLMQPVTLEFTIDGVHPTDLGFYMHARFMGKCFEKFLTTKECCK